MRSIIKILIALAYGILLDRNLITEENFVYPVIKNEPGTKYTYNNSDIFLLSVFFKTKFNKNIKDFICDEIFTPLDIKEFEWNDYNGYCPGETGLYMSHKDLFKICFILHDSLLST